jgi:hypothetical protein
VGKLLQPTMSTDDSYYEEQVWPLTSHTNCYTAYTRDGRWATQRHVCWHVTKKDATTTTDDRRATTTTVRWRELPPGQLCVGYSSVSSCAAPYGWEAYGLLPDQHWQQQQQSEEQQPTTLPVPVVESSTATYSALDGTTTILSNDNNIITAAVAGGHSRSPSLVGLPMSLPSASELLVDSLYNSVPELSSSLDNNDYPLTEPETTILRGRADHNNNNNNVAELIVRNYVSSTTGDGAVTTSHGENTAQHYSLWLSYRPTAIHVTMTLLLKNDRATKTTMTTTTPLVWMGSADHAQLHSYEIAAINNNEPDDDDDGDDDDYDEDDIDPVLQLRHNHEFPASVLAIASNSDGRKLVVASQDGSIVILQLSNEDDRGGGEGTSCRLVTEATVIIDGPILALSYQQDGTITIGSLCGYVARMKDDGTKLEMIVEGLTGHNSQEDAVLAVATTSSDNNGDGHRIWVGTRSGRCLLYRLCNSDDPSNSCPSSSSSSSCWKLEWQVRLPYAVNGIWLRDNDVVVDGARQNRVIVTTARGIHMFRTVHSAVQQARNRLNDLYLLKK